MKKTLLTLGVAATVAFGAASTVGNAAVSVQEVYEESCIAINPNIEGAEKLKEVLENCDVQVEILYQGNCPEIPGWDNILPETSKPETSESETSETETEEPETSAPESELPETTAPETSETETEEPETSVPESELPETTVPETWEPETSEPETQAPAISPEESVHPYVLRVLELVNEERAAAGMNPLTLDTAASRGALVRAKETVKSFSHTRPDGRHFTTALKEQGVNYRMAGENIAWGQSSPEQVMEGWMNSAGHRANILNESYTHIGIGYHQENGVNYWTQLFFQ